MASAHGRDTVAEFPLPAPSLSRPVVSLAGLGSADLSKALDTSAIVAVTDVRGKIVYCNQKFVDVSGYGREELIGATHRIVNSGHHQKSFFTDLYMTIRSGDTWRGTICNRKKNGAPYWVDTTIVPVMGSDGLPSAYIAIRFEVTDHITALKALGEARAVAERATAMRDQFLANMSHEVRTPLNGVLGLASALTQSPLSPQDREKVDLILSSGQTLRRILDDVLDLSKIQAGEMRLAEQPCDPAREITAATELMRALASAKGLALEVRADPRLPAWVLGDPVRIRQIVSNLVANAVKFTGGGSVRVDIARRGPAGRPRLHIRVLDTGRGFDRRVAANLFRPFFQADTSFSREFGGAGLGLSISRRLAELMGGRLRAHAVPGRGSLFVVSLPLRVAPADDRSRDDAAADPRLPDAPRVLLVEDNRVNQQVVQALLTPLGARIDIADDGAAGLALWAVGRYDLVLMDMQMPVMDGLEAIRRIRDAERRQGPARQAIAMLTANASEAHRDQALLAGADMVIPKPFTGETLLQGLGDLMRSVHRSDDGQA